MHTHTHLGWYIMTSLHTAVIATRGGISAYSTGTTSISSDPGLGESPPEGQQYGWIGHWKVSF